MRYSVEGERKCRDENDAVGDHGFTEQEFVGEELEDVEPEDEEPDDSELDAIEFDEYAGYDED